MNGRTGIEPQGREQGLRGPIRTPGTKPALRGRRVFYSNKVFESFEFMINSSRRLNTETPASGSPQLPRWSRNRVDRQEKEDHRSRFLLRPGLLAKADTGSFRTRNYERAPSGKRLANDPSQASSPAFQPKVLNLGNPGGTCTKSESTRLSFLVSMSISFILIALYHGSQNLRQVTWPAIWASSWSAKQQTKRRKLSKSLQAQKEFVDLANLPIQNLPKATQGKQNWVFWAKCNRT